LILNFRKSVKGEGENDEPLREVDGKEIGLVKAFISDIFGVGKIAHGDDDDVEIQTCREFKVFSPVRGDSCGGTLFLFCFRILLL